MSFSAQCDLFNLIFVKALETGGGFEVVMSVFEPADFYLLT